MRSEEPQAMEFTMTEMMRRAREAFEGNAGSRVRIYGGTYTWGLLLSGDDELSFMIGIDGNAPRLCSIRLEPGSDVVDAARAWGNIYASDLANVPQVHHGLSLTAH